MVARPAAQPRRRHRRWASGARDRRAGDPETGPSWWLWTITSPGVFGAVMKIHGGLTMAVKSVYINV